MRRVASFPTAVLAAYLAVAFATFSSAWVHPQGRWIGHEFDPILFLWYLRWMPFAFAHGVNPLTSDYLNHPDGFNLMSNTSILLPAFVVAPLTRTLGTVFAFNLLSTVALALSGWCAYFALRRYVRPVAAAVGGLLYGFSSFMFVQAANHPHMALALFPPLTLLLLDEAVVRQRRPAAATGVILGLAAALQLLTSEELLAMTVLASAIGLALLAALRRDAVRTHGPHAVRALAVSAVVGLGLAAYPLAVQFFGTGGVAGGGTGGGHRFGTYVLDVLELVVPSPRQELTFGAADRIAARFSGQAEIGGYVGIPLLVLAVTTVVLYRRDTLVRFSAALAGILLLLALGPRPKFAGHALPIPLPWALPQRLPVLHGMLPARLMVLVFLLLAVLVAVFIDRTRLSRAGCVAVLLVAFGPLLPNLPFDSTSAASPAFFTSGADTVPPGSVALVTPIARITGGSTRSMLWQADADLRFRMTTGVVLGGNDVPGLERVYEHLALLAGGARAPTTAAMRREVRCTLRRFDIETVVVGPMETGRPQTLAFFNGVLGRPPLQNGGVAYWPGLLRVSRCT